MSNIAKAFIKAKREFGKVLKVSTNPHFKNKYAPLDVCIESVDDACLNNGIAMYQETTDDATGVTVETVFLHESGEALRCGKLHVPSDKMNAQGFGSALTYARRYSLLTACGIAPEDDDGNAAQKPTPIVAKINDEQIANLKAMIEEVKADMPKMLEFYRVSSLNDIPVTDYKKLTHQLEQKRKAA